MGQIQVTIDNPGIGEWELDNVSSVASSDPGSGKWQTNAGHTRLDISNLDRGGLDAKGAIASLTAGSQVYLRVAGEARMHTITSATQRTDYIEVALSAYEDSTSFVRTVGDIHSLALVPNPSASSPEGVDIKSTGVTAAWTLQAVGDDTSVWGPPGAVSAHTMGGASHSADLLSNVNSKISDATLDDAGDPRDPNSHALGGSAHSVSLLAELNAKISDATLDDSGDPRDPNSHAFAGAEHSASLLAAVNSKISDATLIDTGDSRLSDDRDPTSHALGGADHSASLLAEVNSKISDATLIDTADSRLSDSRTPTTHDLGGAEHGASLLSELNAKVSDATLIDTGDSRLSDSRTPTSHAIGGAEHSTSLLAEVNALISDATLLDGPSGTPDGFKFWADDGTWKTPVAGGGGLTGFGEWRFNSSTTPPPATSRFQFNAGNTELHLHEMNRTPADLSYLINNIWKTGDFLYLQETADSANARLYEITGTITDETGWFTIEVTQREAAGTFANNDDVGFVYLSAGVLLHDSLQGLAGTGPEWNHINDAEKVLLLAASQPGHVHTAAQTTSGEFDPARLPAATVTAKGAVVLSNDAEETAGEAVQATDSRLSNARTPSLHAFGGGEHSASLLSAVNAKISDATLIDTGDSRLSDARTPTSHAFAGAEHAASLLSAVNSKISDATLIDTGDARLSDDRDPTSHAFAGADHAASLLAEVNSKVSDATLIDTGDSRLSDDRDPTSHAIAGADHSTSLLADLNSKISDATLDDAGDTRTPSSHAFGGAEHAASLLAEVNAKISDATLIDTGDSRLSDDRDPNAHDHDATELVSGVLNDLRVQSSNVTQHEGDIDHDALTNMLTDEHVPWRRLPIVSLGVADGTKGFFFATDAQVIFYDHSGTWLSLKIDGNSIVGAVADAAISASSVLQHEGKLSQGLVGIGAWTHGSTSIGEADPTEFRTNSTAQAATTSLRFDNLTMRSTPLGAALKALRVGDILYLRETEDPTNVASYVVNILPTLEGTGDTEFSSLTVRESTGTWQFLDYAVSVEYLGAATHALASANHLSSTLAQLNTKISDQDIIGSDDPRIGAGSTIVRMEFKGINLISNVNWCIGLRGYLFAPDPAGFYGDDHVANPNPYNWVWANTGQTSSAAVEPTAFATGIAMPAAGTLLSFSISGIAASGTNTLSYRPYQTGEGTTGGWLHDSDESLSMSTTYAYDSWITPGGDSTFAQGDRLGFALKFPSITIDLHLTMTMKVALD